jgi:hypothetical protein
MTEKHTKDTAHHVKAGKLGGIASAKIREGAPRINRFQAGRKMSLARWDAFYAKAGFKSNTPRQVCPVCGQLRRLVVKDACRTCYNARRANDKELLRLARKG